VVTEMAYLCVSRVSRSLRKHASNTQPGIHEIASSKGSKHPKVEALKPAIVRWALKRDVQSQWRNQRPILRRVRRGLVLEKVEGQ
jgi:hypothetical protein